jgi:hypothetical protein
MASNRKQRQRRNRPQIVAVLSYKERTGKTAYKRIIRHDPCTYCGKPVDKEEPKHTADHIKPRAALTTECDWDNFTSACQPCNNKKGDKPVFVFIAELIAEGKFLNYTGATSDCFPPANTNNLTIATEKNIGQNFIKG